MVKVICECGDSMSCRDIPCGLICDGECRELYCDCCGEQVDTLYYFTGQELCLYCIAKRLEKVE